MCGIAGIYSFEELDSTSKKRIKTITNTLSHRGPDDSDTYYDGKIALGHRRLSIIDLSKNGRQPMTTPDGSIVLIFNGEIYNFKEIREELKDKHRFKTETDGEVILHAYQEWGIECLQRFNGMFALALWDKNKQTLFLVRDRLGIKPLFYAKHKNQLLFGSEPKAIIGHKEFPRKVNKKALSSYLSYRYVLGDQSFFEDIFSLEPGHYLEVTDKMRKKCYWDIPLHKRTKKVAHSLIKKELTKSVKRRMISDVPLGAYLSGGLDSSIVVSLMATLSSKPVKTYSVGFKEKDYNEFSYANLIAERYKTDHKEILVSPKKYLETLRHLIRFRDSPLGVPNEIPLYLMSKELKKDITVVLSGEGADELFGGYGRIFRSCDDFTKLQRTKYLPKKMQKRLFPSLYEKYKDHDFKNEFDHFYASYAYFTQKEKFSLFTENMKSAIDNDSYTKEIIKTTFERASHLSYPEQVSYVFEKIHLPGLLARLDNSTMAASVEGRVPFVDHEFVEFIFSLPFSEKIKWNSSLSKVKSVRKHGGEISEKYDTTKYSLRKAFENDIPKEILQRKKKGFPVPLTEWFTDQNLKELISLLLDKKSKIQEFINTKHLKEWIEENTKNKLDPEFGKKLWMLVNIELWLKEYF